jgi:NitT/TauT family transport system ATP-binding protein
MAMNLLRRRTAGGSADPAGDGSRPIFEVRNLAIGFQGEADVLRGVDLEIETGEFLVLLGPSGCGKTTILNLAAGLLAPRSGYVRFAGREIHGVNTDVGYMTQDDTLLPWQSVQANVGLPLKMRGVAKAEIAEKVADALSLMDLTHAAHRYPGQLSGGMRRRALLARSMIYEPKLLLMDEPFAALDAQMRNQMHIELRGTVKRLNQTVMFVTHDIAEAAKLGDRVLVVGGGPPGGIVSEHRLTEDIRETGPRSEEMIVATEKTLNEALIRARAPKPATPTVPTTSEDAR